jgi:hypothetical protein
MAREYTARRMTPGHRRQPDALLTSVDESGRAAALAQLYATADVHPHRAS